MAGLYLNMQKNSLGTFGKIRHVTALAALTLLTFNSVVLAQPKVTITPDATKNISYIDYHHRLFSLKIPKGFVVGIGKTDYTHFTFMLYDPQNPDISLFFNMKTEGYLKTKKMLSFYKQYYPQSPFAKLPVIDPQTTESFYRVFTPAIAFNQKILPFKVPTMKKFKKLSSLGKNLTGGEIIRGTYQNEKNEHIEGIFTATIKEMAMPPIVLLMVYNTIYFSAKENTLINYLPIFNYCLSTFRFSSEYVNGYYLEQGQIKGNASALQQILDSTSRVIAQGWEKRQKTYDILSQKRSDATLGYERVRDTDTGEIYKADLGFSDYDWHGKYEVISDDMYNLPVAGYIEKY